MRDSSCKAGPWEWLNRELKVVLILNRTDFEVKFVGSLEPIRVV